MRKVTVVALGGLLALGVMSLSAQPTKADTRFNFCIDGGTLCFGNTPPPPPPYYDRRYCQYNPFHPACRYYYGPPRYGLPYHHNHNNYNNHNHHNNHGHHNDHGHHGHGDGHHKKH